MSIHLRTARYNYSGPDRYDITGKNTKQSNGFHLNDKVRVFGRIGFISGFTNSGCYIKDIENNYITIPNKSYKQISFKYLEFLNHNNTWQFISRLKSQEFLPVS